MCSHCKKKCDDGVSYKGLDWHVACLTALLIKNVGLEKATAIMEELLS